MVATTLHTSIVLLNISIRNNIAIFILHIHSHNKPIIKTIHHAVNVTITKAELFTIRCGINQAIGIPNAKCIIIITDFLHTAKKIFNSSTHPYQIYSAIISWELRDFFKRDSYNYINFWNCSSKQKWPLHSLVDKNIRRFEFSPILLSKLSWNFCKKQECNSISTMWKMTFQVLDLKEKNFLELLSDDSKPLEPSTIKDGPWL